MCLASLDLGVSVVHADHAFGTGAIGGIILGMMTRTARGHTGRPLVAGKIDTLAYVLVHAAAFMRVFVTLTLPMYHQTVVTIAALLWSTAFALFVIAFAPILVQVRADGKSD